jgi:DNA primase catalytic subunit
MPFPFRFSTLDERRGFYAREFDLAACRAWFDGGSQGWPQYFVIDHGTETGMTTNPAKNGKLTILKPGLSPERLLEKLLKYLPEDVYYDTTRYGNPARCFQCPARKGFCNGCSACGNRLGQQLVFDVDPENIICPSCGKKDYPASCPTCVGIALKESARLAGRLRELGFRELRQVFSGRGCHVHVEDPDAFRLTHEERAALAGKLAGFPIDPWVTSEKRLIRLPYTLNAVASRAAVPLREDELASFDAATDPRAVPAFLRGKGI